MMYSALGVYTSFALRRRERLIAFALGVLVGAALGYGAAGL